MTAAGVQKIDSAAYLPSPPSTSTPDAKGTSAAGQPAMEAKAPNAHGTPSDFHNELQLQQSGQQETGSAQSASTQAGTAKMGSGKTGKRRDARTDDANPSAVTPVQVAQPQRPVLPFSLALPQEQESAQPDQTIQLDQTAPPDDIAQGLTQQPAQALSAPVAAVAQLPELQQPAAVKEAAALKQSATPKQPAKLRQSVPSADPLPTPAANLAPSVAPDSPKVQVTVAKSEDSSSEDPVSTSGKPGASSENQPLSPADLKLPATFAEPVAAAAQDTPPVTPHVTPQITAPDSVASSPSALAFAARVPAAQPKEDQVVVASSSSTPVQSPAVSGSQTAVQIPVRYAATAQIIQSATLGNESGTQHEETKQEESKKDANSGDGPARAGTRNDGARTDMVLPQFETVSQPANSSVSTAPRQAAPPARAESILEPPAAPPTSSHDIRVQIPNNNGGSTQVRFVESGGEVRVSVRTADEGLAQNLRTHLNDLTQRLSDGGTPAEIWKPASNAAASQNESQQQFQQDGRGSGGQGFSGQNGQEDRQQKRPAWLDEMEASLYGENN